MTNKNIKKAVEALSISYNYKSFNAVKNISFYINQGEFFVIAGPNGSGKTTLVKILAGIIKASIGEIRITETPISAFSAKQLARFIAFVPQEIPISFPFKAEEIVLMGRYPHTGILGIESADDIKIAKEAMRFTSTEKFAKRRLDQLSGGERQRLFIARAITQQPKIIILDEPTASLDPAHQIRLMELLKNLKTKQNTTIIMVSHDLNLASMYAEKILLIKNGEKKIVGVPSQALTKELLQEIYECEIFVGKSPAGNFPAIHLLPTR
ncbi:MAG: ABC transporter ATP-binding protein [Deltaproteobacteria bacterium]|nr:ABC transporter ATP-binding protein [Deltaproteobacteria bacterium]